MSNLWKEESVIILRTMLDDMDESKYKTCDLEQLLLVSAFMVNQKADFNNDYTISMKKKTISPDPSADATKDESFINLICLQAACMVNRGKALNDASNAFSGKDGFSSFDFRGVAESTIKLLKDGGWCSVFEDELNNYKLGQNNVAGMAIMGPFRTKVMYQSPVN
jgi:hypothetical protein